MKLFIGAVPCENKAQKVEFSSGVDGGVTRICVHRMEDVPRWETVFR